MIDKETRSAIKAFLGGFIQGWVEQQRCPESRHTVMGEAHAVYTTFEECARLIALQTEELLEIYREVGREKGKAMIDALAFGF